MIAVMVNASRQDRRPQAKQPRSWGEHPSKEAVDKPRERQPVKFESNMSRSFNAAFVPRRHYAFTKRN